jgi:hypothetical protein
MASATPSTQPTSGADATPNAAPTPEPLAWSTYYSPALGISFEYPAAWDSQRFADRSCSVRWERDYLLFGVAGLQISHGITLTLEMLVDVFIASRETTAVKLYQREPIQAGPLSGTSLTFGDNGLLMEHLYVMYLVGDTLYTFSTGAYRSFVRICDDDALGLFHVDAFYHAVRSFKVD